MCSFQILFLWLMGLAICWEYGEVSHELGLSASTTWESVFSTFTTWVISFILTHHWSSQISTFKMSCAVITKLGHFCVKFWHFLLLPLFHPLNFWQFSPLEARWPEMDTAHPHAFPLVTFSTFLEC